MTRTLRTDAAGTGLWLDAWGISSLDFGGYSGLYPVRPRLPRLAAPAFHRRQHGARSSPGPGHACRARRPPVEPVRGRFLARLPERDVPLSLARGHARGLPPGPRVDGVFAL